MKEAGGFPRVDRFAARKGSGGEFSCAPHLELRREVIGESEKAQICQR
jgi:hypothetical protein